MQKEILTLQFGHYSNFVATHFWNLQKPYLGEPSNPDSLPLNSSLFRYDQTLGYTPRAISYDLKGSLGNFKTSSDSLTPNQALETLSWEGQTKVYKSDENIILPEPTDERVEYWTDYLKHPYHKNYFQQLDWFKHEEDFSLFSQGLHLFKEQEDERVDVFRLLLEECDWLEGLQLFVDWGTGFGGLAFDYLNLLHDDFLPKTPIITFGFEPSIRKPISDKQVFNSVLALSSFSEISSVNVPLASDASFSFPSLNNLNSFQTSALLALSIDTATTPFRRPYKGFRDLLHFFNDGGKGVVTTLKTDLKFPLSSFEAHTSPSSFRTLYGSSLSQSNRLFSTSSLLTTPSLPAWKEHVLLRHKPTTRVSLRSCLEEYLPSLPYSLSWDLVPTGLKKDQTLPLVLKDFFPGDEISCLTHMSIGPEIFEPMDEIGSLFVKKSIYAGWDLSSDDYLETKNNYLQLTDHYRP